jgi:predicted Zn-dependent protease
MVIKVNRELIVMHQIATKLLAEEDEFSAIFVLTKVMVKVGLRSIFAALFFFIANSALAMSEENEVKLGAREHQNIIAQYGVYRDKDLQDYVTLVGQRVADQSTRANLEFHFTVLDDDIINAFALPGGYVYVTRGILTHVNTESELAAILGHEIAHVTEKHGLRNQSKAKLLDLAAQVASMVTGTAGVYDLGSILGGVLQKGYSREFELEADAVGSEYMAKAGYSPDAMLNTIEILKAKDRIEIAHARKEERTPNVYHGFLSTHPDQDTRYKQAILEANSLLADYEETIQKDEFLEKLNGLRYGPTKQIGVVRKNVFYHSKLGIKFRFPQGWRIESSARGVQAVSTVSDAVLAISTARMSKKVGGKEFLEGLGMNVREGKDLTIGKLPAFLGIADRAETPFGRRPVRVAAIFNERRRIAYVLTGAGAQDLHRIAADRDFIATIFSFDKMTALDRKKAVKPRLEVITVEEGMTMEQLADASPITNYALDKLRVINGLYPDGQPKVGQKIKIIN